jgi:phosphoglycerate dehydrogenase-like enzyme
MKLLVPNLDTTIQNRIKSISSNIELLVASSHDEAVQQAAESEASYTWLSPEIIKRAKKLRWVQVGSAGVERYMFPELVNSDIILTNAKGIYGSQIAEHVMALVLSLARALNILIRRQQEEAWESRTHLPVIELGGLTMTVVGLGGIGSVVAKRAAAFDLRIIGIDPVQTSKPDYVEALWKTDRLHEALRQSDFVVICCPLTPETQNLMSDKEFGAMKPSAYLINIARGGIVDQEALVRALKAKKIAGAGLDVTVPEPLPKGHELWRMENVILTPHMAGQSPHGGKRIMDLFCENLRRFTAGEPLLNVVNKKAGF